MAMFIRLRLWASCLQDLSLFWASEFSLCLPEFWRAVLPKKSEKNAKPLIVKPSARIAVENCRRLKISPQSHRDTEKNTKKLCVSVVKIEFDLNLIFTRRP